MLSEKKNFEADLQVQWHHQIFNHYRYDGASLTLVNWYPRWDESLHVTFFPILFLLGMGNISSNIYSLPPRGSILSSQ
jgi:hypothetical protein